jgi:hypothetical protein
MMAIVKQEMFNAEVQRQAGMELGSYGKSGR